MNATLVELHLLTNRRLSVCRCRQVYRLVCQEYLWVWVKANYANYWNYIGQIAS